MSRDRGVDTAELAELPRVSTSTLGRVLVRRGQKRVRRFRRFCRCRLNADRYLRVLKSWR